MPDEKPNITELDELIEGSEDLLSFLDNELVEMRTMFNQMLQSIKDGNMCGKCYGCRMAKAGLMGQITETEKMQGETSAELAKWIEQRGY